MREYEAHELLPMLRAECEGRGASVRFARKAGVSTPLVSQVLNGNRNVSDAIARGLGFTKKVRFVPLQGASDVQ